METDTQLTETPSALAVAPRNIVPKEGGNVAVTALLPEEMTGCQAALIEWAARKIAELQSDADELRDAELHARERKWKTATLHSHLLKVEKRVLFYGKVKTALEAGYVIVPNFPVQLFAIRTNSGPKYMSSTSQWNTDFRQSAKALPVGEGEYQNPIPTHGSTTCLKPTAQNAAATETRYFVDDWDDFDFPVAMAKPQIMEAASRAMALSLFDQLGVLPNARKEDPIIVGQLRDPRDKWGQKLITFFIAWHLDTRVL